MGTGPWRQWSAHLVLARDRLERVPRDGPHRTVGEDPHEVHHNRDGHEEPVRTDRAHGAHVRAVEAEEAYGERRIWPQNGEEDGDDEDGYEPQHIVNEKKIAQKLTNSPQSRRYQIKFLGDVSRKL